MILTVKMKKAVQTFWNQRRKARINKIAHFLLNDEFPFFRFGFSSIPVK